MKTSVIVAAASLLFSAVLSAQAVTDGPYVTWLGDTAVSVQAICAGSVQKSVARVSKGVVRVTNPCKSFDVITITATAPAPEPASFNGVSKIFVASDVEGDYDAFLSLLTKAGVINSSQKWSFGKGHLVLVGDMVDRGTEVTEVLWFIRGLEAEAKKAGGRVDYVLGNHDTMLLYGDHRYADSKYKDVAAQLGTSLLDLYSVNTELGRWMRSKPVMVRIDSVLFTHGGLSPVFANSGFNIDQVNGIARAALLDDSKRKSDSLTKLVFGNHGPFWYRGYFKASPTVEEIKTALHKYGANTVIVGHTIVDSVQALHDNQVIAIDVTFNDKEKVQGVLIENGKFYRFPMTGDRTLLK